MADTLTTTTTVSTIPNGTVIATDDAGAAGHVQIVKLAVSTDGSATALTANNTDGLLVNLGSNNDVTVTGTVTVGSHAVTNAGTFAVQVDGSALTALQLIDDVVFTDDAAFTPATSKVAMIGAEFDDTTPDSVDEGDAGALRMSANRNLFTTIRDAAGNERGVNVTAGNALTVDASATTQPVSHAALTELAAAIDTELQVDVVGALPAGTNNIGDVDILSIVPGTGATNLGKAIDTATGGTDTGVLALATRDDALSALTPIEGDNVQLRTDANGALWTHDDALDAALAGSELQVDVVGALPAGTNAIGKLAANSGVDIGDVDVTSVPAPLSTTGGGTEATALRVTVASDSTGVLSVDDNGAALTVDNGGTFAVQVDGSALTALQLLDDVVFAEDVAAQAADKGVAVLAVRRDADTSLVGTDNDYANLQVDANGYLKVEVFDGGGSHTVDNAGTFAVQVDGNALTALQLIDNPVLVDDAGFTPATSSVMMAGFEADEASTDSVDEGDAGAARMTLDRKIIVNPQPHTGGGLTIFRSLDLDETEEEVKASAGQVYGWAVTNTATTTRWLKFYNATAANVSVGSTTPVITWGIPGNTSDDVSANVMGAMGIAFDTAITVAATTGVADADTGAPAANDVIVNIFYK